MVNHADTAQEELFFMTQSQYTSYAYGSNITISDTPKATVCMSFLVLLLQISGQKYCERTQDHHMPK